MLKRFLISPPFGNWFSDARATRVRGSFTRHHRPGLLWHALKTIRPRRGGWVNRVGLRNPGIENVVFDPQAIHSVVGLVETDWLEILSRLPAELAIEVNLGCPNVHAYGIDPLILLYYAQRGGLVIAKISPTDTCLEQVEMCASAGINYVHLSNTLPCADGGLSGAPLKAINRPLVREVARRFKALHIIAGGGIYTVQDVKDYAADGAEYFSLSTAWVWPPRARRIMAG